LWTLLRALDHQSYDDFEVVVVIGPTHDYSVEMVRSEFPDRVTVVRCPEFNLSCSRNLGLEHAAGEVVAFIDDDAVPSSTWLEQIADAYGDEPEIAGAGGRTHLVPPGHGQVQFLFGLVSVLAEQQDVRSNPMRPVPFVAPPEGVFPRFHGTNMTYRLDALRQIGGFDERFEYLFDDADIAVRLGRQGLRLEQLPDAVVYHAPEQGRNRGAHPYDLNWYSWLRSSVYFVLKNGRETLGLSAALGAAVRRISGFFTSIRDLVADGRMPPDLARKARGQLRRGAVEGLWQGVVGRRRIPDRLSTTARPFTPFKRPESRRMPAASPYRPSGGADMQPMETEPLRICLLSVGIPPKSTHGVARSTATLARGLVELGHHVHVITSGRRRRVVCRDGVFVHQVASAELDRYRALSRDTYPNLVHWLHHSQSVHEVVTELVRSDRIQIVDSPLWGLDGIVTAVAGTIPVAVRVVTAMKQIAAVHDQPSDENRMIAELERELLDRADLVISNSSSTTEAVREVYGLDPQRYFGEVPYGMVPSGDDDVVPLRIEAPEEPIVLFVGRLEGRKGILELFEAIPPALASCPSARFVIVGEDNSREDGFMARRGCDYPTFFSRTWPSHRDRVTFRGHVDDDELTELYRSCDLFVAPSHYESFGLIFLEAMDMARPVIGCAAGGPTDIIVDGRTGLLVPPRDPARLAHAIIELLGDHGRRRQMGLEGRRRLLERFTHTTMAAGFVDLYREVVTRSPAAGRAS
jgi:glycosyltransferase involved in cell wall biosynthesis/GT2 family glycosyltransferase